MSTITLTSKQDGIITYSKSSTCLILNDLKQKLKSKNNLTLPFEEEIELLNQLTQFELGRFLLINKGLNGYWTAYIILYGLKKDNLPPLEDWLLKKSPVARATQERFRIFSQQLQSRLKDGMTLASIPCGLMDVLLRLDYSNFSNIQLVGIDLDPESLKLAEENAKNYKPLCISYLQKDAWNLGIKEEYDIITSNGLNIYQPDDQKVIALYKEFFKALKPGGVLITSFLTPPPALCKESPWKNYSQEDLLKQKAIFTDIIEVSWQTFRTETQMREHLKVAGFKILEVIYDSQGMFPTIIAQK